MKKVAITNRFNNTYLFYKNAIEKVGAKGYELGKVILDSEVPKILDGFDALIMTGGGDVSPHFYNMENTYSRNIVLQRDESEIVLAKYAYKNNIPVLAICRGMQVANVAFGGTLFQDNVIEGGFFNHFLPEKKYEGAHDIKSYDGSLIFSILGENSAVNSIHHQSVKNVAKEFSVTSRSLDGCIESMEGKNGKFLCLQWHPERLCLVDDSQYALFENLIK